MEKEYVRHYVDMLTNKKTATSIRSEIRAIRPEKIIISGYGVLELICLTDEKVLGPALPLNDVSLENTNKFKCLLHAIEIELERLDSKPINSGYDYFQSSWMCEPSNIKPKNKPDFSGDKSVQAFSSALPIFGNCTHLIHELYTDVDNSFTAAILYYMRNHTLPNEDGVILFGQSKRYGPNSRDDVYYRIANITVMGHQEVVKSLCLA